MNHTKREALTKKQLRAIANYYGYDVAFKAAKSYHKDGFQALIMKDDELIHMDYFIRYSPSAQSGSRAKQNKRLNFILSSLSNKPLATTDPKRRYKINERGRYTLDYIETSALFEDLLIIKNEHRDTEPFKNQHSYISEEEAKRAQKRIQELENQLARLKR